jgi:hypothetical protein
MMVINKAETSLVFFNKLKCLSHNSALFATELRGKMLVMKHGKQGHAMHLLSQRNQLLAAWVAFKYV